MGTLMGMWSIFRKLSRGLRRYSQLRVVALKFLARFWTDVYSLSKKEDAIGHFEEGISILMDLLIRERQNDMDVITEGPGNGRPGRGPASSSSLRVSAACHAAWMLRDSG